MTQSAEILARRLAAIVESSDDAIISKDLNGIITSWNRAAELMFGFTADEQIGRSILTIIPIDRESEERDVIAKIKRGEIVDHYETVRRRKDGSEFDISLTISPIRNAEGIVVGASKIARDITERKRATQAVAAARLEAEEANRLKDEFLATLSHELRTPLNALVGYTRMLRDGKIGAGDQPRAFEILERNASLLTRLVDDMLDVSAIISGKTKLNVRPVVLSQLIDQAVAMITPTAAAKGVNVETALDRFVAPLTADPDRLHQVLWNLLANAVKFTARGGVVKVALESSGEFVEIVVTDTGSGINASFLPYVFDRFRQSERESSGRQGGLGLGLAISRHIVELHGGTITADSDGEGKGATFRILLPFNVAAVSSNEEQIHPV